MSKERLSKTYNPCDECNYAFHRQNIESGMCKICEFKDYINLEKQGLLLRLPCKVGDTIWELCRCDDDVYRIFPMVVKCVEQYGSIRLVKGKEPTVWNIYAESDYTYMYKSFYDIGKTVFLTKSEAEEKLREIKESEE